MMKLTYILTAIGILISANITMAQTGTYCISLKTGASCTVAVVQKGNKINTQIFAWWHTPSGRQGAFTGEGFIKNNQSVVHNTDPNMADSGCGISLNFAPGSVKVNYSGCEDFNLMEDFSGTYKKLSDNTPGNYVVIADKSYFYKKTASTSRLKTYLVKGNKVDVDIENVMSKDWVFINFTNARGKITSGYMRWAELKKL